MIVADVEIRNFVRENNEKSDVIDLSLEDDVPDEFDDSKRRCSGESDFGSQNKVRFFYVELLTIDIQLWVWARILIYRDGEGETNYVFEHEIERGIDN